MLEFRPASAPDGPFWHDTSFARNPFGWHRFSSISKPRDGFALQWHPKFPQKAPSFAAARRRLREKVDSEPSGRDAQKGARIRDYPRPHISPVLIRFSDLRRPQTS